MSMPGVKTSFLLPSRKKNRSNAEIMMSLEENSFTHCAPVIFINPSLGLNFSIPFYVHDDRGATKIPSTINSAIYNPKIYRSEEIRFALMPFNFSIKNANNKDKGMTAATTTVVRQSAINKNTITVTSIIPSTRLCITVLVQ